MKYKLALNYLREYNLKIISNGGMVNLDEMKQDLCTQLALIWGISGDFNISALVAANGLIEIVASAFSFSYLSKFITGGTGATALIIQGAVLNKLLFEYSKNIIESVEKGIKKINI
jgi:hypothetical protein